MMSGFLPAIGTFLTFIKLTEVFFPDKLIWLRSDRVFFMVVIVSIVYSMYSNWPSRCRRYRISGTDAYITIKKGDIFRHNLNVVIPSSNFFNTDAGIAASTSVLGQYINKYDKGDSTVIEKDIEKSLEGISFEQVPVKMGKNKSYPIGTIASFNIPNGKKGFLSAITQITEDNETRIESNISFVHIALNKLWDRVETEIDNGVLAVVPFGSGVSRAFNRTTESVIFIAQSFIDRSKKKRPCSELVIFIKENSISNLEYIELHKIIKFLA
jgi:hypothetical protein